MEHANFQEEMRNNPEDANVRLGYADYLDDNGHSEAASRLRSWGQFLQKAQYRLPASSAEARATEAALPDWAARLNQVHTVRKALSSPRVIPPSPEENHFIHQAELHAYGLLSPEQYEDARRKVGLWSYAPGGDHFRKQAVRGLLNANPKTIGVYPPNDIATIFRSTPEIAKHQKEHRARTAALVEHMKEPTRLARPLEWIKRKLLGGPATAEPLKTWPIDNAVKESLRTHGHANPDLHLPQYITAVNKFLNDNPEHPRVKLVTGLIRSGSALGKTQLAEAVHPLVGAAAKVLPFIRNPPPKPAVQSAPAPVTPEPEPVIPLEEETPAPTEDRHSAILRLIKAGKDNDTIVSHLMDVHGAKDRATAMRWRRAALQRAIVQHEKSKKKFARPKPGESLKPRHLTGEAWKDDWSGSSTRVHPQIAGTTLAYHLRQIGQEHPLLSDDAERALSWSAHSTRPDADPFANLGRKLKQLGSRFADAHEWSNLQRDLLHEQAVEQFVNKHVGGEDLDPHTRWDRVYRQFGRGLRKTKDDHDTFWSRFNLRMTKEQAVEAMHRIADRYLDRAYIHATGSPEDLHDVFAAR